MDTELTASLSRESQYVNDLIAQIARDDWTITNDPTPAPDVGFYIKRMDDYRQEVLRIKEQMNVHANVE